MAKRQKIDSNNYLKGLNDVIGNIQEAVDSIEYGSSIGLADALLYVASESQQKAPVDTGDLRGSVLVELDGIKTAEGNSGGGISISGNIPDTAVSGTVSFNTSYAADQHEHTEYDHPKGGQAKYLESTLTQNKDRILRLIADGITDKLGG